MGERPCTWIRWIPMNLDDLIYRRNHPLLKAGKKPHSLLRTLLNPMGPLDFGDDDIRVYVYPEEETRREDLEILGQDLWEGFLKQIQETGCNEERPRRRRKQSR